MNFLAHAYLSGDNEKVLLGNFMGDFVKGKQALQGFDREIIRGVELHRAIDDFTDNHPLVDESKNRLRPTYRHYAGVIVDVFYDHFLALHWPTFHDQPLETFASNTYKSIENFTEILPAGFKRMLPYMIRGNWLVGYRQVEGIHRALSGMASRTPYVSKMERASEDLRRYYDEFNAEFQHFFPLLKVFSETWLKEES